MGNLFRDTDGKCSWEDGLPENDPGEAPYDEDRFEDAQVAEHSNGQAAGPLSDQASVDREAAEWARLWKAGGEYGNLFEDDIEPLPPLQAHELVEAAMSFPAHTGLGADNVSPRALARLPPEALEELARLLHKAELLGTWTSAMALVLL